MYRLILPLLALAVLTACGSGTPGGNLLGDQPATSASVTVITGTAAAWKSDAGTLSAHTSNFSNTAQPIATGTISRQGAITLPLPEAAAMTANSTVISELLDPQSAPSCTNFPKYTDAAARFGRLDEVYVLQNGQRVAELTAYAPATSTNTSLSVTGFEYYYVDRPLTLTGRLDCNATTSNGTKYRAITKFSLKLAPGWNVASYSLNIQAGTVAETISSTTTTNVPWYVDSDRSSPIEPVVSVTLAPTVSALYVGQTTTLAATAKDAQGNVLSGRSVTWTSSDQNVVQVNASGGVTADTTGSAIITATIEGRTGTIQLTVLPRPTPHWTRAGEWGTHNGNASHDGYVDATLDPASFRALWTSQPIAGRTLSPAVVSGDMVYVTSSRSSGEKVLSAVSLMTGNTRWSHDLGSIHNIHHPTVANSRVYLTTSGHGNSYLYAFDAQTGQMKFRSPYGNQWESYFAPVVVNGRVHMAGGMFGGMYAFSATDGQELWFRQTNQYDQWTPAVKDGVTYAYTGSYSPELLAVDAATGEVRYRIPDPDFEWSGWSINSAPVVGRLNNVLAIASGRAVSFDLTNRRVAWSHKGGYTGTVTLADGTAYLQRGNSIEARTEHDGSLQWLWIAPDSQTVRSVVVTNNLLLVSTASTTYAIDLSVQKHVWSVPHGGHLSLSGQGVLLIAQTDGKLTAIAMK